MSKQPTTWVQMSCTIYLSESEAMDWPNLSKEEKEAIILESIQNDDIDKQNQMYFDYADPNE